MKYFLVTALAWYSTTATVWTQVYTFDYFAHTDYINKEPGEVILLRNNWEEKIEYTSSGKGYHITYIYNVGQGTVETLAKDSLGNSIADYHIIDPIEVLYSDSAMLHVFNPEKGLFSLFYLNERHVPYLVIETLDGHGFFTTDDEFTYQITKTSNK